MEEPSTCQASNSHKKNKLKKKKKAQNNNKNKPATKKEQRCLFDDSRPEKRDEKDFGKTCRSPDAILGEGKGHRVRKK